MSVGVLRKLQRIQAQIVGCFAGWVICIESIKHTTHLGAMQFLCVAKGFKIQYSLVVFLDAMQYGNNITFHDNKISGWL